MSEPAERSTRLRRLVAASGVNVAAWSLFALLFLPQTYLSNQGGRMPLTWSQSLAANLILFYTWAAITPLVFRTARRFPVERPDRVRHAAALAGLALPFAAMHMILLELSNRAFLPWFARYEAPVSPNALIIGLGATDVMIYSALLFAAHATIYFRRYKEKELGLARANIQALKMQLNPHFLFNTLNAISELVYEDAERADRTITELGEMLRASLGSDQAEEVPLREELAFLAKYVRIQQTLLQDRLVVRWSVEDEALDAYVPNMILQPLVENAIVHGVARVAAGGSVEIRARRDGDRLVVAVEDDGAGVGAALAESGGIGLANTRARLAHHYGARGSVEPTAPQSGGFRVRIEIPYRAASEGRS
jgi:signal transduction histidine kinase